MKKIVLLLYPFENEWSKSVCRKKKRIEERSKRQNRMTMDLSFYLRFLKHVQVNVSTTETTTPTNVYIDPRSARREQQDFKSRLRGLTW